MLGKYNKSIFIKNKALILNMATANFDDFPDPSLETCHTGVDYLTGDFLKCCSDGGLQVFKVLVISRVNLALDKTPKEEIHWG